MLSQIIGGNGWDEGHSVQQTTDDGFIVGGWTYNSFGNDSGNVYLIKTDSSGYSGCNESNLTLTYNLYYPQERPAPSAVSTFNLITTALVPQVGYRGDVTNLCSDVGINESINGNNFLLSPTPPLPLSP